MLKNRKLIYWLFLLASVIGAAVRTAVKLKYMDGSTGFYTEGNALITAQNIFYVVVMLLAIVFGMTLYRGASKAEGEAEFGKMLPVSVAAFLSGAFVIASGTGAILASFPAQKVPLFTLLFNCIGVLAGAILVYFALQPWGGRHGSGGFRAQFIIITAWILLKTLVKITTYETAVSISDQQLEIIIVTALCVFFFGLARLVGNVDGVRGRRFVVSSGLAVMLSGIPYAASVIITAFTSSNFSNLSLEFASESFLTLLAVFVTYKALDKK